MFVNMVMMMMEMKVMTIKEFLILNLERIHLIYLEVICDVIILNSIVRRR